MLIAFSELPDMDEKFIESVVKLLAFALNAVMEQPVAVENTSVFTVNANALILLVTFILQSTLRVLPTIIF